MTLLLTLNSAFSYVSASTTPFARCTLYRDGQKDGP